MGRKFIEYLLTDRVIICKSCNIDLNTITHVAYEQDKAGVQNLKGMSLLMKDV